MDVKLLFKSLVENAIDFADKSVEELKKGSPKYSLINFCTALELFLKARLMLEHWTLVVSKLGEARPQRFQQGDFHSVSMEEAIERLQNVVGENFTQEEKKSFQAIREQRNRMVHFLDPSSATRIQRELQKVAVQECVGWYHLYEILQKRWKREFKEFRDQIDRLGRHLHQIRAFLTAKYTQLAPQIAAEKSTGIKFKKCPACELRAYRPIDKEPAPAESELILSSCVVCDLKDRRLIVSCPECDRSVEIEEGEGECPRCGCKIGTKYLVDKFTPGYDPKDEQPDTAYCTECGRTELETVVPIGDEQGYVCISCLCTFNATSECGYCGSRNAGEIDSTDSYLSGCVLCEGMVAQDNS
jgi:hypothetical protein